MTDLDLYTPEICAHLRRIAETRQWQKWPVAHALCQGRQSGRLPEAVLEDVELTYHLHLAAEASGQRAGMHPMPPFPLKINLPQKSLDPAEFILHYLRRHPPYPWNRSDNGAQTFSACA